MNPCVKSLAILPQPESVIVRICMDFESGRSLNKVLDITLVHGAGRVGGVVVADRKIIELTTRRRLE